MWFSRNLCKIRWMFLKAFNIEHKSLDFSDGAEGVMQGKLGVRVESTDQYSQFLHSA